MFCMMFYNHAGSSIVFSNIGGVSRFLTIHPWCACIVGHTFFFGRLTVVNLIVWSTIVPVHLRSHSVQYLMFSHITLTYMQSDNIKGRRGDVGRKSELVKRLVTDPTFDALLKIAEDGLLIYSPGFLVHKYSPLCYYNGTTSTRILGKRFLVAGD